MGYPADGIEGKYRNHKDQVSRYLKMKHYAATEAVDPAGNSSFKARVPHKIKIYNLCIEKNK